MMKAALMTDAGPIALLGITEENLRRMKAGMPIDVDLNEIRPPGRPHNFERVVISYAATHVDVVLDWAEGFKLPSEVRRQMLEHAAKIDATMPGGPE